MTSLLIDYNKIIKPSMTTLLKKIGTTPPKTPHSTGLVLILPKNKYEGVEKVAKGSKRLDHINTPEFVDSIITFFYIIYDLKKQICEICPNCGSDILEYLDSIIEAIYTGIPRDTVIWIGFRLDEVLDTDPIINNGFMNPYICRKSPLGYQFKDVGIGLYKKNVRSNIHYASINNEILYVIQQYKENKNNCELLVRFNDNCIKEFKKLSDAGKTKNKDGTVSQKEIGGTLYVVSIEENSPSQLIKNKDKNKFVFVYDINKSSMNTGVEEEVEISATRYNFHSHPKEAYARHSVTNGWPSAHDFLGFMKLKETIFHCVVTIEGIYIISYNKKWSGKVPVNFIKKKYSIDHSKKMTPKQYTKKVNNIKYKSKPVFTVQYLNWDECSNYFSVYYEREGVSCIPTDSSYNDYERFYK